MRVYDTEILEGPDCCEIHAKVKCDAHWVWGDDPFELWYRYPAGYAGVLDATNGDPFVAACLAPAMVLGETLCVEGTVSCRLAEAVPRIQAIFRRWCPALKEARIEVTTRSDTRPAPSGRRAVGVFFSLGVDSCYTLSRHLNAVGDEPAVTHLINVLGFDIYLWEMSRYPLVLRSLEEIGQELAREVLPVVTNLREWSDRIVSWADVYHGAALASVALALPAYFRQVYIAASTTYERLYPLGSHPLLDPLWSTEDLSFIHDGCEAERLMEKLSVVCRYPALLKRLRVCIANDTQGSYNCGRCGKCMRLMVALRILGVLQQCQTLPHSIDLEQLRSMEIRREAGIRATRVLTEALESHPELEELRNTLEEVLARVEASSATVALPRRQVKTPVGSA